MPMPSVPSGPHPALWHRLRPDGLLAGKFGVKSIPTSFLIDRSGQIQWRHEGFQPGIASPARQIRSLVLAH